METHDKVTGKTAHFLNDEAGTATVFGLFATLSALIISGIALDSASGRTAKSHLQATADAAALAAAMNIEDVDVARSMALDVAARNMPNGSENSAITADDIVFGEWTNGSFTRTEDSPNAVIVTANRSRERGNQVSTYLMRLVGVDAFDVSAGSIAVGAEAPTAGSTGSCASSTILTEGTVHTGGNNHYEGSVCIHGQRGILTGGAEYYGEEVRVSAPTLDLITINGVRDGSADPETVKVARTMEPVIVPQLDSMFDTLWDELQGKTTYSGDLLPTFIFENGVADVVHIDQGWWAANDNDLDENTIYVVNHGMQISGGVDKTNIAIIAKGQIGIGGGPALSFEDVYFFSDDTLNFSGNVMWGNENYCDVGRYNTYLFATNRISLGGWGNNSGVSGVIAAAPDFSPGGAMRSAGGVYFESTENMHLGGNVDIRSCDVPLTAEIDLAQPDSGSDTEVAGSYLVR